MRSIQYLASHLYFFLMLRHLQQANPSATLRGGKASTHNERSYHTSTHASNPLHVFYYLQELTPSLFLRLISLLCLKTMKPKNIVVGITSKWCLIHIHSGHTIREHIPRTFSGTWSQQHPSAQWTKELSN